MVLRAGVDDLVSRHVPLRDSMVVCASKVFQARNREQVVRVVAASERVNRAHSESHSARDRVSYSRRLRDVEPKGPCLLSPATIRLRYMISEYIYYAIVLRYNNNEYS